MAVAGHMQHKFKRHTGAADDDSLAIFFLPNLHGLPLRHGSGDNVEQTAVGHFLAQQLFDVSADVLVGRVVQTLQHGIGAT